MNNNMNNESFEGIEKRLVVQFFNDALEGTPWNTFRDIPVELLQREVMEAMGCSILDHCPSFVPQCGVRFDSYILSESSLFVYDDTIIVKTCGTIRLALFIPIFLIFIAQQQLKEMPFVEENVSTDASTRSSCSSSTDMLQDDVHEKVDNKAMRCVRFTCYSHLSFDKPANQPRPHRSFQEEIMYFTEMFGTAPSIGEWKVSAEKSFFCLVHANHQRDPDASFHFSSDEMWMFGIDPVECNDRKKLFGLHTVFNSLAQEGMGFGRPKDVDETFFEPVGYSSNVTMSPNSYLTAHVSPEPATSYASIEYSTIANCAASRGVAFSRRGMSETPDPWVQAIRVLQPKSVFVLRFDIASSPFEIENEEPVAPPRYLHHSTTAPALKLRKVILDDWESVHLCVSIAHYKSDEPKLSIPVVINNDVSFAKNVVNSWGRTFIEVDAEGDQPIEEITRSAIKDLGDDGRAIMIVNLQRVMGQFRRWRRALPNIQPCYAVKCNGDIALVDVLRRMGAKFDCASSQEFNLLLSMGCPANHIIFSHPVKNASSLEDAKLYGIKMTVFDNTNELYKIAKCIPNAEILLRIRTEDADAQCPLSVKYGAPASNWKTLLSTARELKLNIVGIHFHVGSGCRSKGAFNRAFESARSAFDVALEYGFKLDVLDIGGGFPGEYGCTLFEEMATEIRESLVMFDKKVQVMAEPGRFFAAACQSLVTKVIGKREPEEPFGLQCEGDENKVYESNTEVADDRRFFYYINDGVYGSFNSLVYDHATTAFKIMGCYPEFKGKVDTAKPFASTVFGQTCDGFDSVMQCVAIPELSLEEWLCFDSMGAYTLSAASTFNGFETAKVVYSFFH